MDLVRLGATANLIPRIAFGCAGVGGHDYGPVDDTESIRAIHRALDLGVVLFDTADVYGLGHSEEVLGRALEGRRNRALIATKVGIVADATGRTRRNLSPDWIRQAVDASLRRLRTDAIDIYQVHWPDPAVPLADSLGELVRLRELGKIRHIGVCNFPVELLETAIQSIRLETVQLGYNLGDWQEAERVRTLMRTHALSPLLYNCLAQGLLTGKYDRNSRFDGSDRRQRSGYFRGPKFDALLESSERVRETALRRGRTSPQVAIRWVLDSWPEATAIVGVKRREQLEDAAGALGWTLTAEELAFLRDRACPATVVT